MTEPVERSIAFAGTGNPQTPMESAMTDWLSPMQTLASNPETLVFEVNKSYQNVESAKRDARDLEELLDHWKKRTKEIAQNPTVLAELPDLLSAEWFHVFPIAYIVLKGSWDKRIVEAKFKFGTTKNPKMWVTFVNEDFILPLKVLMKCFDQFIALSESNHSPKTKGTAKAIKNGARPPKKAGRKPLDKLTLTKEEMKIWRLHKNQDQSASEIARNISPAKTNAEIERIIQKAKRQLERIEDRKKSVASTEL